MKFPEGSDDADQLIVDHLGLAQAVARRFVNRGEPLDDLVQVASMGLVKAARRFDATLDVSFSTYATSMMLGELKHHFRDRGWQIKTPRRIQDLYLELNRTTAELSQQLGRSPTVHELAVASGARDDEVIVALDAGRGYRADSIDALPTDSARLARALSVQESGAELEDRSELHHMLTRLPQRDRLILQRRFIDDMTQDQIAHELNMSQMHVSRILRHALDALREMYGDADEGTAEH